MDKDKDLDYLLTKKLLELRKKIVASEKPRKKISTNRDILISRLVNRGLEVLELAEKFYPIKTAMIVDRLADLIKTNEVRNSISGGELLDLFRSIGLNIKVNTSIHVEKDGKLVPLSDKLKSKD